MSFSFDASLGAALDRVRLNIADTVSASHLVEDETITALLATDSEYSASAKLCGQLAMQFARQGDVSNLSLSVGMGPAEFYAKERDRFARLAGIAGAGITIGGLNVSDFVTQRQDTSITQPAFTTDGNDFPGTSDTATNRDGWADE